MTQERAPISIREKALRFVAGLLTTVEWAGLWALVLWTLSFWSLVLRARARLGEWPHPTRGNPFAGNYQPSPLDPNVFELHYELVCVGFVAAACLLPLSAALIVAGAFWPRLGRSLGFVAAFLVAASLAAGTVFLDPGGFWIWFID